jgi:hypothetical protein
VRFQSRAKKGFYGAFWEALLSIKLFINHIKYSKMEYEADIIITNSTSADPAISASRKALKISLNNCWNKLNKYYKFMNNSSVYAASIVFYPVFKWRYFESEWKKSYQWIWLRDAKTAVKKLWNDEYKNLYKIEIQSQEESQCHVRQHREPNPLAEYMSFSNFYEGQNVTTTRDKYEKYLRISAAPYKKSLKWWKEYEN